MLRGYKVRIPLTAILFALLMGSSLLGFTTYSATCTGADPCHACKNCRYCKHCAKEGGTCGVCKTKVYDLATGVVEFVG